MKHTRAPWQVDWQSENANSVSIVGPDSTLVADIIRDHRDLTDADRADARLIATAPEMLAALQSIVYAYRTNRPLSKNDIRDIAESVITKSVRGENQ